MEEQKMKEEQERRTKKKLEKRVSLEKTKGQILMLQEKLWHYRKKSTCFSCRMVSIRETKFTTDGPKQKQKDFVKGLLER